MADGVLFPLRLHLKGIDVILTEKYFVGMLIRAPMRHTHPWHELVCICSESPMRFILYPPNYPHMAQRYGVRVSSFLFTFTEEMSGDICDRLRISDAPVELEDTFGGAGQMESLFSALSVPRAGLLEELEARIRLLLVSVAQAMTDKDDRPITEQTIDEKRLGILEDYFNVRFRDPQCSKAQLADLIGVSERQLTRILSKQYHRSFSEILLDVRMSLADGMLQAGERDANVISDAIGFPSGEAMELAYKCYYGKDFPKP